VLFFGTACGREGTESLLGLNVKRRAFVAYCLRAKTFVEAVAGLLCGDAYMLGCVLTSFWVW
jgi:hypothetical protein